MLLFTHPTGNANVRHAALGLLRAGLLGEFLTCLDFRPPPLLERLLPGGMVRRLRRRSYPAELSVSIRLQPVREVFRLCASRLGLGALARHEHGPLSVDAVYRALDHAASLRLRSGKFSGVYAYEDGAEASFRMARARGLRTFYDLPIGYWRESRRILREEAEREPEWASTLDGNRDSDEKNARKDAELARADVVFVASSYTLRTLDAAPDFNAPVVMIPYGAPPPVPTAAVVKPASPRLRVLFVGSLGQRKGLSYLFAACRLLGGAVELTVIGQKPSAPCPALERELRAVRWIPTCAHTGVLAEMAGHDVLVFPSLFEGFGLVLLEALAMGLPIITTAHTAGPDLIREGVEGFIVPIRSSAAIAACLETLHRDPARLAGMSAQARVRAREFSWSAYESTLALCAAQALAKV